MSSFVIYQSEYAVRTENTKLRGELTKVRDEANDLRRRLGEQEVAYAPLTEVGPVAGQTFKSGSCTVQIGAPGGGYRAMPSPQMGQGQAQGEAARQAPEVVINGRHVQPGTPQRALPAPAMPSPRIAAPATEAELEAEALGAVQAMHMPATIQTQGREGQKVTITTGALPRINPMIAQARGIRQPAIPLPAAQPVEAPVQVPAQVAPVVNPSYVDADDTSVRMSLLEL